MARVIKADTKKKPKSSPAVVASGGGKIIGKEVYHAQMEARNIVKAAEIEATKILQEGKKKAARKKDEALNAASSKAFSAVALEALLVFERRAEMFAKMTTDIDALSKEILVKIFGDETAVSDKKMATQIKAAIFDLRAKQKIKFELPLGLLSAWEKKDGEAVGMLKELPEFDFVENKDISAKHVRVVIDVGTALCEADSAFVELQKFSKSKIFQTNL